MTLPSIGCALADFSLPATHNETFSLARERGKIVVLYFYPKDNTPGCTTQAQQFRDLYADFCNAGAIIAGVSRDSIKSHENFAQRQNLPFPLLSDADEMLCTIFAVIKQKKLYGKEVRGIERSTFVIDRDGVLRREWRGVRLANHVNEVLTFVRTL